MSGDSIRITVVNHATVDIGCEPQRLWRDMVESFVEDRSLVDQGLQVTPLVDDPAALLGGYRVVMKGPTGDIVDDRIVRVTERDEQDMRLSLCVRSLVPHEAAMLVNASCRAIEISGGVRYETHSHANFNASPAAGQSVADAAEAFRKQAADYLHLRLAAMKSRLETCA